MSAEEIKPTVFRFAMEDGSEVVLRWENDQVISQHEGHDPMPLGEGPLHVIWVSLRGLQGVPRLRVMFVCDLLDDADQVEIDTPYMRGFTATRVPGRPWFWPVDWQLFRPGPVEAKWQVRSGADWLTIAEQHLLLEEWGFVAGDSGLQDDLRPPALR